MVRLRVGQGFVGELLFLHFLYLRTPRCLIYSHQMTYRLRQTDTVEVLQAGQAYPRAAGALSCSGADKGRGVPELDSTPHGDAATSPAFADPPLNIACLPPTQNPGAGAVHPSFWFPR